MRSSKLKICQLCAVDFTLYHFLIPLIDGLKEGWEVEAICSYGKHINPLRDRGYIIKNIDIPRNLNPFKILNHFSYYIKYLKKKIMILFTFILLLLLSLEELQVNPLCPNSNLHCTWFLFS